MPWMVAGNRTAQEQERGQFTTKRRHILSASFAPGSKWTFFISCRVQVERAGNFIGYALSEQEQEHMVQPDENGRDN